MEFQSFQGLVNTAQCAPGPSALVRRWAICQISSSSDRLTFLSRYSLNQNYITAGFPLAFQPFGYRKPRIRLRLFPQANLSVERDLGGGFALSLAYNFNGGDT